MHLYFLIEVENCFQLGYTFGVSKSNLTHKYMTLTELPKGKNARVVSVNGASRVSRRLMEMGVIPGVGIEVIKMAPFGDPIEIRVRGYSLAMRKSEADGIEVSI